MAGLLSLPREIRDRIVECVAHLRVSQLPTAAALLAPAETGRRQTARARNARKSAENSVCFESRPRYGRDLRSLAQANRQLRHEVRETIRRLAVQPLEYVLDVVYLNNLTLWPTWLSVPILASRVDTLHAQFRILDISTADVGSNDGWQMLQAGDGAQPFLYMMLHVLLQGCLRFGPRGPPAEGWNSRSTAATEPGGLVIKTLILDFLPVAKSSSSEPTASDSGIPEFLRSYLEPRGFPGSRIVEDRIAPPADDNLIAGYAFSNFVTSHFNAIIAAPLDNLYYGRILFERVGFIEVRVNGKLRSRFDLGAEFATLPGDPDSGHFIDPELVGHVRRRRLVAGLPVRASHIDS